MSDRLRRTSVMLLLPPVLMWIAIISYIAGWQPAGAVFDALPAWLELGALLACPILAIVLRQVWLRRPEVHGPYVDAVTVAAVLLTLMAALSGLRPS